MPVQRDEPQVTRPAGAEDRLSLAPGEQALEHDERDRRTEEPTQVRHPSEPPKRLRAIAVRPEQALHWADYTGADALTLVRAPTIPSSRMGLWGARGSCATSS